MSFRQPALILRLRLIEALQKPSRPEVSIISIPYHANVPSFGEWGFILASETKLNMANPVFNVETKYVDYHNFRSFFIFDKDTVVTDVEVNLLDKPVLLDYYLRGWEYYK